MVKLWSWDIFSYVSFIEFFKCQTMWFNRVTNAKPLPHRLQIGAGGQKNNRKVEGLSSVLRLLCLFARANYLPVS
jgi:hypothetical protein